MYTLLESFTYSPAIFLTTLGVLGLLVGSLLNVVIYRLPIMLERTWRTECEEFLGIQPKNTEKKTFNLFTPASQCSQCGNRVLPWHNIPIISFFLLKRKCANCKHPISWQYPIVELLSACLSVWVGYSYGTTIQTTVLLPFVWTLLVLAVIDIRHQILPDTLTFPLLWGGLLANSFSLFSPLDEAIWGAATGYLSLWAVFWGFKIFTGKDGIGFGDLKLMAVLGAWLGYQILPLSLLISSLVGTVITSIMIIMKMHSREKPVPFGPYIVLAAIIALFWGEHLTNYYAHFMDF